LSSLAILSHLIARERERWPFWLPVFMAAGVVAYFNLPFEPPVWALLATPVLGAAVFGLRYVWWPGAVAGLTLLFCAIGFNAAQLETRIDLRPMLDREMGPVPITGRLMLTEFLPEGVRVTLKDPVIGHLRPEQTPEKIRLRLQDAASTDLPPAGSMISLFGRVGPFSEPVMPGAFDFRRQAFFRQLGGLGWSYGAIKTVEAAPASSWRDGFNLMFEQARATLAQHVREHLDGDVAAMTIARLNGQQTGISQPVIDAMRIAGLAHLLSTSGFHVTIMGLLIYFPLRAMLALIPWVALTFNIKKIAAAGAIVSAMAYTFLVGAQPATLRSLLMTALAMLAILVDRRADPMRLVMLSALLAMALAPDAVMGPSFQMSFAAVFCLIAAHKNPFAPVTTGADLPLLPVWIGRPLSYIGGIMRTSLIATAATTPFAVYHFQTFSFYGFIANMLAIPLTSFWVMPCILAAYVLAPLHLDGWFIDGAGAGIALTIKIAETVASWPLSIFYLPAMPGAALILITLGGLWLCLMRQRWRYTGLVPILIGAVYMVYTPLPDVMVTADGKEWAARLADGRLAVSNLDHDAFTVTQWQQRLGNLPTVDVSALAADDKQIACDALGCTLRAGGHLLAMPEVEAAALQDCRQADIVIAPYIVKACAAPTIIDDPLLWRRGGATLTFKGKDVVVNTVRARRGERPWSPGWARTQYQEK